MSFGKSSSSSAPVLTQEQKDAISAQTNMLTGTIIPAYQGAVAGAKDIYNLNAGGVLNAAQNAGGVAQQAQTALGETGESALRTGITGLESLFSPGYEKNQMAAQQAQFGGSGNLGSARQALAGQQLAGQNQALQASTAAQIQQQIAGQRMGVGATLAGLGQGGLGGAQAAAANKITASMTPQQLYNQYASVLFGTPSTSYSANFAGTQGQNTTGSENKLDFGVLFKK